MRISDWSSDVCSSDLVAEDRSEQSDASKGRSSGLQIHIEQPREQRYDEDERAISHEEEYDDRAQDAAISGRFEQFDESRQIWIRHGTPDDFRPRFLQHQQEDRTQQQAGHAYEDEGVAPPVILGDIADRKSTSELQSLMRSS